MVTQLLFGDLVEIQTEEGSWKKIEILEDRYPGWVDAKQLTILSDEQALILQAAPSRLSDDILQAASLQDGSSIRILLGSSLPDLKDGQLNSGAAQLSFAGSFITPDRPTAEGILRQAMKYLNALSQNL